ncbi:MAG TPA: hypothetical protein VMX38_17880 [Verrucomicrobiae bacterium]|jgi:hypothetical protein|nr:hypothetical protein [Verrucomicrobiae bacterium]
MRWELRAIGLKLLLLPFLLSAGVLAQNAIPPGTILPLQLSTTIRSRNDRPGLKVTARIRQDVPLSAGSKIPANSRVIGEIVAVTPASPTRPGEVTVRFDKVIMGKQRIPVVTDLRALANMMDVSQAQIPMAGPDRGTSEADWVTEQIGGDLNYHGAYVTNGSTVVGRSMVGDGVLAQVRSGPQERCRGEVDGNDQVQALWLFSSDACGLFGYPDLILAHTGRRNPVGEFRLTARRGDLTIRGGSGLLLRVNPSPRVDTAAH